MVSTILTKPTPATPFGIRARVLIVELVTVLAMGQSLVMGCPGFSSSGSHSDTAMKVYLSSDRFQMIRIDTATDAAQMVKIKAVRNWPLEQFVDNSVRESGTKNAVIASDRESCVAALVDLSSPEPAACIRLRREQLLDAKQWRSHGLCHADSLRSNLVCGNSTL